MMASSPASTTQWRQRRRSKADKRATAAIMSGSRNPAK